MFVASFLSHTALGTQRACDITPCFQMGQSVVSGNIYFPTHLLIFDRTTTFDHHRLLSSTSQVQDFLDPTMEGDTPLAFDLGGYVEMPDIETTNLAFDAFFSPMAASPQDHDGAFNDPSSIENRLENIDLEAVGSSDLDMPNVYGTCTQGCAHCELGNLRLDHNAVRELLLNESDLSIGDFNDSFLDSNDNR